MKKLKMLTGAIMVMASMVFSLSCERDCPTCPKPPLQTSEHIFYVGALDEGVIKTFSAEKRMFIDSIQVVVVGQSLALDVVGNDEMLAISTTTEGVRMYDLRTHRIAYSFPDWNSMTIDPLCRYFLIANGTNNHIELRQFENFDLIFTDTMFLWPEFSFNGSDVAYSQIFSSPTTTSIAKIYNIESDSVIYSRRLYYGGQEITIFQTLPVVQYNKLFFIGGTPYLNAAFVVDLDSDTARLLMPLGEGTGWMKSDIDGERIFIVNHPGFYGGVSQKIYVYSVASEGQLGVISTAEVNHEPASMAITADGRFMLTGTSNRDWPNVALVDLQDYSVVGAYDFSYDTGAFIHPGYVATKKMIKWER